MYNDVWVIIPAFNEDERLEQTLQSVCESFSNVVVVDDGSDDQTHGVAARHPLWLLRHIINCGQGAALQTGIDFALRKGAAIIVTFDADGQHCVEDIPRLCEPILAGRADVVLGSRFLGRAEGIPWARWLTLKLGVLFTRLFSGIHLTDTHNGLRALSRVAAQRIHICEPRMAHASEILDQLRQLELRFCEVPMTLRYWPATLQKGQTSWNSLRIVGQLLIGRLNR